MNHHTQSILFARLSRCYEWVVFIISLLSLFVFHLVLHIHFTSLLILKEGHASLNRHNRLQTRFLHHHRLKLYLCILFLIFRTFLQFYHFLVLILTFSDIYWDLRLFKEKNQLKVWLTQKQRKRSLDLRNKVYFYRISE